MPSHCASSPSFIQVSAAVIIRDGRVLLCRRAPGGSCGGLWEFPGGKIEPGETAAACAVRECQEELGVAIKPLRLLDVVEHTYPDKRVTLYFYAAQLTQGEPSLHVHTDLAWVLPPALCGYSVCPADEAFLHRLVQLLSL